MWARPTYSSANYYVYKTYRLVIFAVKVTDGTPAIVAGTDQNYLPTRYRDTGFTDNKPIEGFS